MNIIFIVAGTYQQAKMFVKRAVRATHPLRQIKILTKVNQMKGVKSPTVLFYGTYFDRPDIDDIVQEALAHDGILVRTD